MPPKPFFSLTLTAWNAEPYIGACIDSLLHQTCKDWECFVIDDHSSDHTPEIMAGKCDDPRFNVTLNEKQVFKLKNVIAAVPKMTGSVYVELDGDDRFYVPNALEVIRQTYLKDPRVDATHGSIITSSGKSYGDKFYPVAKGQRFIGGWISTSPRTQKLAMLRHAMKVDQRIWTDTATDDLFRMSADVALFGGAVIRSKEVRRIPHVIFEINDENPVRDQYIYTNDQLRAGDIMLRRFLAIEPDEAPKDYKWSL